MSDNENIVRFPDLGSVEAEAAEWVARLESGTCTADDYAKFEEWLSRNPLAGEAASRLFGLWSDFDALKDIIPRYKSDVALAETAAWTPALLWHGLLAAPWRMVAYAAASVVMLFVAGFFFDRPLTKPPVTTFYQTAVGGHKTVQLLDGSTVTLNTNSRLEAIFSDERRDVRLLRGEAYFEIAHSDTRPFTVISGEQMVRDIGTAFDVRSEQGAMEVTVTKGAVEVMTSANARPSAQAGEQQLNVVTAGQEARFDRRIEYLKPVSYTDINRQLAWRQGVLVYVGQPLSQVVADVSRYTQIKIELGDPSLGKIPVGGYFEINKLGAIFVALEKNFGIRAEWSDASHVRLVAAGHRHARQRDRL